MSSWSTFRKACFVVIIKNATMQIIIFATQVDTFHCLLNIWSWCKVTHKGYVFYQTLGFYFYTSTDGKATPPIIVRVFDMSIRVIYSHSKGPKKYQWHFCLSCYELIRPFLLVYIIYISNSQSFPQEFLKACWPNIRFYNRVGTRGDLQLSWNDVYCVINICRCRNKGLSANFMHVGIPLSIIKACRDWQAIQARGKHWQW